MLQPPHDLSFRPDTFVSRPAGVLVEQGGDPIVVKMSLSETNQAHPHRGQA